MDEPPDLYRELQVDPRASYAEIRASYRALARVFHPDVEGDDEAMKRLNRAWAVLGDASRRAKYDRDRAVFQGTARVQTGSQPAATPDHAFVEVRAEESAGPPPGRPSGPVLDYGRYKGWSLGEIARFDRAHLEWLRRVPAGRSLRRDIDTALEIASWGTGLGGRPVVREAAPARAGLPRERVGARC